MENQSQTGVKIKEEQDPEEYPQLQPISEVFLEEYQEENIKTEVHTPLHAIWTCKTEPSNNEEEEIKLKSEITIDEFDWASLDANDKKDFQNQNLVQQVHSESVTLANHNDSEPTTKQLQGELITKMCVDNRASDDTDASDECVIVRLLKTNFSSLQTVEKCQIIANGRPTPPLPDLKQEVKSSKKSFVRTFQITSYEKYQWLTSCCKQNNLFCWPCLLFNTKEVNSWNKYGYNNLNNFYGAAQRHANTLAHKIACLDLVDFRVNPVDTCLDSQRKNSNRLHNEKVKENREILKRLIDAVLHLASQELAFRGHNEKKDSINKGNYKALLDLISKYDQLLKDHLSKSSPYGTSNHIQNDIIASIARVLLQQIYKEIEESKFIAILLVETTDTAMRSQLSTVVRYCRNNTSCERFLGFTDVSVDRSASNLLEHVKKHVELLKCGDKLVGQGYDGAAVMAGQLNGLQAKVREIYPHALFFHCSAHVSNLVLSQIGKSIPECRIFFELLNGFASFFAHSSKRCCLLKELIKVKFPKVCSTRWCYQSRLLNSVFDCRQPLKCLFESILDPSSLTDNNYEWAGTDIVLANGFISYLNEFKFNFLLTVFSSIFEHTDQMYDVLQNKSLDINICIGRVDEAISYLTLCRDKGFDNIYDRVVTEIGGECRKRTHNKQSPRDYYRALYTKIYATIITQIEDLYKSLKSLKFTALLDHRQFKNYDTASGKFPTQALKSLEENFSVFFNIQNLKSELCVVYNSKKFEGLSVTQIYCYLNSVMSGTFIEVLKLCELIITLPCTTVSVERTFSAMKRIINYLRNSMGQERLSYLSLIAIEQELLKEIEAQPDFYDRIIEDFIDKDRRMDFIYRR